MKKILVIDDDVDICLLLTRFLTKHDYEVSSAHAGYKALDLLKKDPFDLVLSDFRLGDTDGTEVLIKIKELYPDLPVIIITGYSDIKVAVRVIKLGAYDYITKPLLPEEILHTVRKALETGSVKEAGSINKSKPRSITSDFPSNFVIGESTQAKELYKQIDLVSPTNYSVIIMGESGTGKESVAHAIHNQSNRRDKPFIPMDCGSLSKELAGSELFGHEKGSFTGALNMKVGHFEMANGGTLFLDEVGNLSYEIQVSLLRVVQERKVKRIGSTKEINLDVRIIIASNENLFELVQRGKFREDLYHRFNEFCINIPSLRERNKDIMSFASHFLSEANTELNKDIKAFHEEVVNSFMTYSWPGNLRELKNVIKRAALLTTSELITPKTLPMEISNNMNFTFNMNSKSNFVNAAPNLKNAALEAENETIMNVLKQVNFNKTKAAKILNIDRKTLYNKMKAFNI